MSNYIAELIAAINRLHGCDATHIETVPVKETFEGQTMWEGDVEVFETDQHPKAKRIYAWSQAVGSDDVKSTQYIAVLGSPPVDSAQAAVRTAIMATMRATAEKAKGEGT